MTQPQLTKSNFAENFEAVGNSCAAVLDRLRKKIDGFADGELEDVMNRFSIKSHLQHVRLETFAFALRTAHIKIA